MSTKSRIEWTEQTWNPITGCTKISAGCKHCYAEVMAIRLKAMGVANYRDGFKLVMHPDKLNQPLDRKKPTLYFVNSMSDLFHEDVPFDFIDKVFKTISKAEQHTFQILTKRAKRMHQYFQTRQVPSNAWLGVTVEDVKHGVPRIDYLRQIKASILFLSIEPLLEYLGKVDLTNIDWVIVGGESGTRARPMLPEWVRDIKNQCEDSNVSFFFKQWGGWGSDGKKRNKHLNGRLLDGKVFDQYPAPSIANA